MEWKVHLETLFFAVVAILVLGRLYQVLGQNHDTPPGLNDKFVNDQISPNGGAFGLNNAGPKTADVPNFTEPQFQNSEEILKVKWGDLAPQIIALRKREPLFDPTNFQETAALAYDAIISAVGKNDKKALRELVDDKVYAAFSQTMDERAELNRGAIDVVKLSEPQIKSIEIDSNQIAQIDIEFKATLSAIGESPRSTDEIWTFERKLGSRNPIWLLVAVEQK